MEPLAAAVVAIATVLATKAVEKTGENVGQVVWNQTNQFVESLRKQSPNTVMAIEQAPEQPLDYAEVVLEVEAAAKQNPEVAQAMEHLVTTVDAEALPNLESIRQEITKALESHQATSENYNIENLNNQTRFNQAPPLPPYYVERPEVSQQLKQILLSQETAKAGTLVVSAIYGLGGIGKSTLAAALAHDSEVQSHFPDGIFWATLGQQPDILSFLSTWIQQLVYHNFKPINIDSASLQLRTLLSDKKALLVVDDVWHPEHVEPFRVGGGGCRVLVTTREAPVKGAIRYDLDVMTLNQSLELLTGCLQIFSDESTSIPLAASPLNPPILGDFNSSSPQNWGARGAKIAVNNELTNQELEYAQTLAKTVGYLPLALELAAAQVRDGLSWQELLGELEDLIVGVEALDRLKAEEEPSDAKRKNYSLVASFNLSLKGLSDDERLKNFAWLGILPEDVTITETMATTLWDCNLVEAKDTLRYLRQKALLLPGLSTTPETNYRLHDLLHDLARRLVQPELGLSIPSAHQQLLERYQTKTDKGLWHTLPDDGYIYSHLIWHLEKAKKINDIHQLLKEETPAGDNGWYWQCERHAKTANFIKDVSKAWAIAADNFTENPTESISLQCRYALITTSLNSLAGNIPPELMAALVKNKIWTPAQALAYVRQKKDSFGQAKSLEAISEYLPPSLLPEALDCARGISDEYSRADALETLAPHLPDLLLLQALDCARGISDEKDRANALRALAPHLPDVLPQALDCARGISDEKDRADALVALAPYLPDVLLPKALDCARGIKYENDRAKALVALAPHLPDVLPQALDCARGIKYEYDRANALVALAPHLPEVLPQALDCARGIKYESSRALALIGLAPHCPEVLPEALDCARGIESEFHRANTLAALAPHLPDLLLPQALDCARGIESEFSRANALAALAPHLPDLLLPQALDCARGIESEFHRANTLAALAPHLPDLLLPQALDCARGIEFEFSRALILVALASHLPDVLPEALDYARGIKSEEGRADALVALAPHLPEVLPQALDCARGISDERYRANALVALAPHLPEVLPQALDCARGIKYEYDRALPLIGLAPHCPEVLPEALDCARAIRNEENRADALVALAPHLPDVLLPQALDCARGISDERYRANALRALAPHLPQVWPEALDCARGISNEFHRADALVALAPHFPDVLLPKALDCAIGIESEFHRADALVALAPHLPNVLLPQALDCARGISNQYHRARALVALVPHLPDLLPEALDCARGISDQSERAYALTALAPHLTDVLLPQALDCARGISSEYWRAFALIGLAPHLPDLLPEALDCAIGLGYEPHRAEAVIALAPHLPDVLLPQALDCAIGISHESKGAYALEALAPHLPDVLLPKALDCARGIGSEYRRAKVLQNLIKTLTPSSVDFPLWQQILDCLASLKRADFLKNFPQLAPLIIKFGGVEALRETVAAVDDVSRWWK
ncbi:NB-ARC domain-containing protein [Moorena producens]|uniref:NB-ARC domain-containing protein n=1 Tax=Moorena producens TaxID=1155739 RepID=UPI003C742AF0